MLKRKQYTTSLTAPVLALALADAAIAGIAAMQQGALSVMSLQDYARDL